MRGATPLVYVYNTTLAVDGASCVDIRSGKDRFERKLHAIFATHGLMTTEDPSSADLFYHPACLTDLFWQARALGPLAGEARGRQIEEQVLSEISSLGYSLRPHVINAERCFESCRGGAYTKDAAGRCRPHVRKADGPAWAFGSSFYPTLWGSERFKRFCGEAPRPVDMATAAYLPYCPAQPTPPQPFLPSRPTRALFIGSATVGRTRLLAAASRTPGVVVRLLSSRAHNESRRADIKELMRTAT